MGIQPVRLLRRTGPKGESQIYALLEHDKDDYTSQWFIASENRCIFRAEKGYLGLGLKTIRAGDRIYLLQGVPVPYALQHQPTDPDGVLDFEGEAYVHGIMCGDVVETGSLAFRKMTVY